MIKLNISIIILYLLLSIVITYPLIIQIENSIYGIGHDNLGWLNSNFIKLKIWSKNLNPENIDYLGFPNGIDTSGKLFMYTHEILNNFLLAIIKHPIISYNLYFIIKLVLSGFCMYQLLYYLCKNRKLSFIIGCCYAYSPYFLNMSKAYGASFVTFALPIVILFLLKIIEKIKVKYLIYFIFSFLILLGENYYYGYYFAVSLFLTIPVFIIIIAILDFKLLK